MIPTAQSTIALQSGDRSNQVQALHAQRPLAGRLTQAPGFSPLQSSAPLSMVRHGAQIPLLVEAQLQPNFFLLRVADQQIAAFSRLSLATGQLLTAQVDRSGPGLMLKIDTDQTVSSRHSAAETLPPQTDPVRQLINRALRFTLPRQQPLNQLMPRVGQLPLHLLDNATQQAIQPLLSQGVRPRNLLQPQHLLQALSNSGVLLENHLLQHPQRAPADDFKARLLQTLQRLSNTNNPLGEQAQTIRQLREITESALARIEQMQLSIVREESGQRQFSTDLVLREGDRASSVTIDIEEYERHGNNRDQNADEPDNPASEAEHRWQVKLSFDLPLLGQLEAIIGLDQQHLQIDFRTDNAEVRALLTSQFDDLAGRLTAAGNQSPRLTAGVINPQTTKISTDGPGQNQAPAAPLIDLQV